MSDIWDHDREAPPVAPFVVKGLEISDVDWHDGSFTLTSGEAVVSTDPPIYHTSLRMVDLVFDPELSLDVYLEYDRAGERTVVTCLPPNKETPESPHLHLATIDADADSTVTHHNREHPGTPRDDLRERLAALEHDQWMYWVRGLIDREGDNLPEHLIDRWETNLEPYEALDEDTKDHDRKWARKVMEILENEGLLTEADDE